MSQIADKIKRVRENVQRAAQQCGRDAEDITLIAVTKTVDVDAMEEAIAAVLTMLGKTGYRSFAASMRFCTGKRSDGI